VKEGTILASNDGRGPYRAQILAIDAAGAVRLVIWDSRREGGKRTHTTLSANGFRGSGWKAARQEKDA
jgi:hypothetical protein